MSAAIELGKVLRAEADVIGGVRADLRDSESERDEQLATKLNNASELVRVLARMVEGKSLYESFGAPGDFGYESRIGAALYAYYSNPVKS